MPEVKELVVIETDQFNFTIKGKPYHPDWKQMAGGGQEELARLEIAPLNCQLEEWFCFDPSNDQLRKVKTSELKTVPFFFEWQDYELIIEVKNEDDLEFYHQNQHLREAVTPLTGNQNIVTGTINFRTDVGFSQLQIREAGVVLLNLTIEVFPSKIDYKTDYQQLLKEVNQEVYKYRIPYLLW